MTIPVIPAAVAAPFEVVPKEPTFPAPHLHTPRSDYDFNFAPGKVVSIQSNVLLLQPFVPSEHARHVAGLFSQFPAVNSFRYHPTGGLRDLLETCETIRQDKNACLWAIFQVNEGEVWETGPPINALVGMIGLDEYNEESSTIECAYEVIFPPFQRLNLASHATSLIQAYVFTQFRLVCLYAFCHRGNIPVIRLGQRLGFRKELLKLGLGWGSLRTEGTLDAGAAQGGLPVNDPRSGMLHAEVIKGSISWREWGEGVGKEFADSIGYRVREEKGFRNGFQRGAEASGLEKTVVRGDKAVDGGAMEVFTRPMRNLESKEVSLILFNPLLHAKRIFELSPHPQPESTTSLQMFATLRRAPTVQPGLEGLLAYFEHVARDETACAWAIVDKKIASSTENVVGFVILYSMDSDPMASAIGPMFITPSPRHEALAIHTLYLLQSYTFSLPTEGTNPSLPQIRLGIRAHPEDTARIALAKKSGFGESGVMRDWFPGMMDVRAEDAEGGTEEGEGDEREQCGVLHSWWGEMNWWEWETGKREVAEKAMRGEERRSA